MKFKRVLPAKEIDIYDAPMEWADGDCELLHSDATIHFEVNIESREYGIKSIGTYVNKIEMSVGDDDFVFEDEEDGWRIEVESDLSNGGIALDRVEIDYEQKIITTYFS